MKLAQDLTGQKFHKLTVLRRSDRAPGVHWICRCECGNEKSIPRAKLRNGRTKSCGCIHTRKKEPENEIKPGDKFGLLTVVRLGEKPAHVKTRTTYWVCKCECGNEAVVAYTNLLHNQKSCGCLRKLRKKPRGESGQVKGKIIHSYKKNAEKRSLSWELTNAQATALFKTDCHYCGRPPSQVQTRNNETYTYNGIDRVDNAFGYKEGNVVACCKWCNWAKNEQSLEEFRGWVLCVAERFTNNKISNLVPVPQMVP
jgi:hypothetical protein